MRQGRAGKGRERGLPSLVLAALFLLDAIDNRAGFRDSAREVAFGVHVADLLGSTNNFATDQEQGQLISACEAVEEGLQDLFIR